MSSSSRITVDLSENQQNRNDELMAPKVNNAMTGNGIERTYEEDINNQYGNANYQFNDITSNGMDYGDIDINSIEMEDFQDISELIEKGRSDSNYKSISLPIHQNQLITKKDSRNCLKKDPVRYQEYLRKVSDIKYKYQTQFIKENEDLKARCQRDYDKEIEDLIPNTESNTFQSQNDKDATRSFWIDQRNHGQKMIVDNENSICSMILVFLLDSLPQSLQDHLTVRPSVVFSICSLIFCSISHTSFKTLPSRT